MVRKLYIIPVVGIIAAISGCARPGVVPKPFALQERENAARDWHAVGVAIADNMADRRLLPARPMHPVAGLPVPPGRYYINLLRPTIPFLREVRDSLKADIIARGGAVSTTPADSLVVNVDVVSVAWSKEHLAPGGEWTLAGLAAGGGEVLAANGPYSPAAYFGLAAGLGIALDVIQSLSPETNVEVVWKASIIQGDTYLMEALAPVYVRAGDLQNLYWGYDTNHIIASYEPKPERSLVQLRYAQ